MGYPVLFNETFDYLSMEICRLLFFVPLIFADELSNLEEEALSLMQRKAELLKNIMELEKQLEIVDVAEGEFSRKGRFSSSAVSPATFDYYEKSIFGEA